MATYPTLNAAGLPAVTFLSQAAPLDEYGRALFAVARSILRALLDSLSAEDLADLNTPLAEVRMRQLAKVVRIERDKGMRGDGFEWAVHEAIIGREQRVLEPIAAALRKASRHIKDAEPTSLLFGHERARYLGFIDAVIDEAGTDAHILPDSTGRPFKFGPWVSKAARGIAAEPELGARIQKIWKTDLFLSTTDDAKHFAATVKSSFKELEGGAGLRIGIVPESPKGNPAGLRFSHEHNLWVVSLADPNGFMGLFNDGYNAVARAMCALGKQTQPAYYTKPSAKAQALQSQIEKYGDVLVREVEAALDEAAQKDLVQESTRLVSVNAPNWLHIKQMAPRIIAPRPKFSLLE